MTEGGDRRAQQPPPTSRIGEVQDAVLAERAAGGDGEAFGVLVERYALAARRVARAILDRDEDADDAVQNGLISAWQAIGRFDLRRPFRPWLMRIVTNAALDLRRRQRVRRASPLPETVEAEGPRPDRATARVLFQTRLREALTGLPERQRTAVVLFDVEGYSHGEIAEVLGVPEGTVRSYVFHARRALRQVLEAYREDLE